MKHKKPDGECKPIAYVPCLFVQKTALEIDKENGGTKI